MEFCIFITRLDQLNSWNKNYKRIYFGSEFCSHLIPEKEDLNRLLDFVQMRNLSFCLVSGYATNQEIKKYEVLLDILMKRKVSAELIINDWGVLELSRNFAVIPVLGRLLIRQKKDPQILKIFNKLPPITKKRYQAIALNEKFSELLKEKGIKRIEIDNLFQGVTLGDLGRDFSFSLYTPYAYLTTTRLCPSNASNNRPAKALEIPFACTKECLDRHIIIRHVNMPYPLILKGNTIFYRQNSIGQACKDKRIDRFIFQLPFAEKVKGQCF
ncbi:MAG: hypothetical protein PHC29_05950 [Candidatus Omnitrophica bacterium]|nr:hypothetical protein [Candidatus Omnitrophota bacterium]